MLLFEETQSRFTDRLRAITPKSERVWGRMTPGEMMTHMNRMFEVSLGEVEVQDESNLFTRIVLRRLAFHIMPWPKGKINAPAYLLPPASEDLEADREALIGAMDRFVNAVKDRPLTRTRHPAFGLLTLSYWRCVHGMHFDHHLRQFGV